MGFSTVAASIIVFAGLLFLAGSVANAMFEAQRETDRAERERDAREQLRRDTDMSLNSVAWQGNRVHVYLHNDGDAVLDVSKIQVFIDGAYGTNTITRTTIDGRQAIGMWAPGQELYLRIDTSPKPQRVYIVTELGIGITVEP